MKQGPRPLEEPRIVSWGSRRSSNRLFSIAEAVNLTAARWGCVQACCWVDVHGEQATTPAELAHLLSKRPAGQAAELYDLDHVFTPNGSGETAGEHHSCVQTGWRSSVSAGSTVESGVPAGRCHKA